QPGEGVRADVDVQWDGVWGKRVVERGQCEQREFEQCGVGGDGGGGGVTVQHRDYECGGERADELHDQLCERVVDGGTGVVGGECEQHEPCVRGDEPGVHGQLQWICERGRSERVERVAGIDDGCQDEQSCGQLHHHQQYREFGGDELLGESDERDADDRGGRVDIDGEQPGEGVRADVDVQWDGVWGKRVVERGQCEQRELEQCGVGGDGSGGGVTVQHRDYECGGERVDELHDQLCERVVDGGTGVVGGECEQHEPCVRGDEPGVHGQLQWICERGRSERVERVAGPDHQCQDEQSGGQLHHHQQYREFGGDELLGESDERDADDRGGWFDIDGEQPGEGVRADVDVQWDGVWGKRVAERGQCEQREFEQRGVGGDGSGGWFTVQHRDYECGGERA